MSSIEDETAWIIVPVVKMFVIYDDCKPIMDRVEPERKSSLLVITVFVKLTLALIAETEESAYSLMVLCTLLLISCIASKKFFCKNL